MPAPTAQSYAERVAKSRSRLYLSIQYEQPKYSAATRYLTAAHTAALQRCSTVAREFYSPTAEGTSTSPSRAGPGPGWGRLYNRLGWMGRAGPGKAGLGRPG
jgi:hypothetical protein